MYVIAGGLFRHHHALGRPARPSTNGKRGKENKGKKAMGTRGAAWAGLWKSRGKLVCRAEEAKRRKEEERRERGGARF
jgi:hypothetical protein